MKRLSCTGHLLVDGSDWIDEAEDGRHLLRYAERHPHHQHRSGLSLGIESEIAQVILPCGDIMKYMLHQILPFFFYIQSTALKMLTIISLAYIHILISSFTQSFDAIFDI